MGDRKPLIFFEDDVTRVLALLEPFQLTTRTRANVVVGADGRALASCGEPGIPEETVAALVGASFAATRQIAQILNPDEILTLTHPGKSASIQLTALPEGAALVTVFDSKTTVAAIAFYLRGLVEELSKLIREVADRKEKPVDLGAGFGDAAAGALDDVLGGG